ncbi:MAG: YHS domain-containing protein [Gammaproteobacteria bacterium]|nr:YHS domain-containing protein [Gammaproteobacteria bacterium]
MEKDPVCGMLVDPEHTAGQRDYQGRNYYFCSPACLAKFDQAPQRYHQEQVRNKQERGGPSG